MLLTTIIQRTFSLYRTVELIALVAISSSLFLILHTRDLHSRLKKMEVRLQPGEDDVLSANQLSSGKISKSVAIKVDDRRHKSLFNCSLPPLFLFPIDHLARMINEWMIIRVSLEDGSPSRFSKATTSLSASDAC